MVKFEYIELEGFGSILKPLTYRLDSLGLNIIQASNGKGKTTIFSGLSWVWFGELLKEDSQVETWEELRDSTWRGTKVGLSFYVDETHYEIYRCKQFKGNIHGRVGGSNLMFFTDGKLNDRKGVREIEKEIYKVLPISFEIFKNSVLFGQKLQRLVNNKGADKKKIFEELFDVTILKKATDLLEQKVKKTQTEYVELLNERDTTEELITGIQNNLQTLKDNKDSFDSNREESIKAFNQQILALEQENEDIQVRYESKEKVNKKRIDKINQKIGRYTSKIVPGVNEIALHNEKVTLEYTILKSVSNTKSNIESLKTSIAEGLDTCSQCGKPYTHQEKWDYINAQKQKLYAEQELLGKVLARQEEFEAGISTMETQIRSNTKYEDKVLECKKRIKLLEKELSDLDYTKTVEQNNKTIKSFQRELDRLNSQTLVDNTEQLNKQLSEYQDKLSNVKKSLHKISVTKRIQHWLKEKPLSNKGLKAFIFNEMLLGLNQKLLTYEPYIGFKVEFMVDINSTKKDIEVIIYREEHIKLYGELSGGQQQLVDIAVAFAFHDLINDDMVMQGINFALFMIDEIFESLDKDNIEVVSDILISKSLDKYIHIITHRQEFNPPNARVTKLAYNNGLTTIS